jgi:diguanylate cyclase (GGDEF)-like protein/PAS domain S-box-containing protein
MKGDLEAMAFETLDAGGAPSELGRGRMPPAKVRNSGPASRRSQVIRHALLSIAFVAAYVFLSQAAIIHLDHLGLTLWYPANGLVLALLLCVSPWYALLAAVTDMAASCLLHRQNWLSWSTLAGAPAVTAIYAAAAVLLHGRWRIHVRLGRRRDVLRYEVIVLLAALLATVVGVSCLALDGEILWSQWWTAAIGWYCGDAIALTAVAPFLLIHVMPCVRRRILPAPGVTGEIGEAPCWGRGLTGRELLEAAGQAAALLAAVWLMFGSAPFQIYYMCFIPVLWAAIRQGVARVVSTILALDFAIVLALSYYPSKDVVLLKVALLMLSFSLTGLIVGASVSERQHIANALGERTRFLNSLIENSPFGIVVVDGSGKVTLANRAFQQLFEYSAQELVGSGLDELICGPGRDQQALDLSTRVLAGEPVKAIVKRRRKHGALVDLELYGVPLKSAGKVAGAYAIYRDLSEQVRAEAAARQHEESLKRWIQELEVRNQQMALLSQMGNLLQCCTDTAEAWSVLGQFGPKLLPEAAGGTLLELNASHNQLSSTASWGATPEAVVFGPETCWALRKGSAHWSEKGGVVCGHLKGSAFPQHLCVPVVAQGEGLGILQLQFASEKPAESGQENHRAAQERMAITLAGQLALSLASLNLQAKLRQQSIRDPLTGFFNRRFMQEAFDRELVRSRRKNVGLAVLFADLDHFKQFNDSYGHEAGDRLLQQLADIFRANFRADDVICRYGGEEFVIIMPESSGQDAAWRAEELRKSVETHAFTCRGEVITGVTISIGVAAYPDHGATCEELLLRADAQLYEAKRSGRNNVRLAAAAHSLTHHERVGENCRV